MNPSLIIAIVASLCVGGAAGAGVTHYIVEKSACPQDATWQKFISSPPLPETGKTYK